MKNQCGKIGIDCEWCDNSTKCLTKEFYKNELNKSNYIDDQINGYATSVYHDLSRKIKEKDDFVIAKPYSDNDLNYITISVINDPFPQLYKTNKEGKIVLVDASFEIFTSIKSLLKDEFDFSEMLLSYKEIEVGILNKKVKIYLYFIP